jgi:alpha-beta hydrolase superfamily lysophospholipase
MKSERVSFYSDELLLQGDFYFPDNLDQQEEHPLIVICSGFTGLNSFHPARFARFFTARGLLCFGFDYRGFGTSQGSKGRVILEEQVRDIRHACSYATSSRLVDKQRVFLLGWGMAGGLVLDAARSLYGVRGIACLNGFYSGKRLQLAHRKEQGLAEFIRLVDDERIQRTISGRSRWISPFTMYPLDPSSEHYVDEVLRKEPGYANALEFSFELADSLLQWYPEAYAPSMQTPLLLAHGANNKLHPPEEAQSLYDAYAGKKELYWMADVGHTEWMLDNHQTFRSLSAKIVDWISEQLQTPVPQEIIVGQEQHPELSSQDKQEMNQFEDLEEIT